MSITIKTWLTAVQKALAPVGFSQKASTSSGGGPAGAQLIRKQEENWAAISFSRRPGSDAENLVLRAGVILTIDSVARFEGDRVRQRPRVPGVQPKDWMEYEVVGCPLESFVDEGEQWRPASILVEAVPVVGGELKYGHDFLWGRGSLDEMVELVRARVTSHVVPVLDKCTTDRNLLDHILSGGRFGSGRLSAYNMAVLTRCFGPPDRFEEYAAMIQRAIERGEASTIGSADLDRLRRGDLVAPPWKPRRKLNL